MTVRSGILYVLPKLRWSHADGRHSELAQCLEKRRPGHARKLCRPAGRKLP